MALRFCMIYIWSSYTWIIGRSIFEFRIQIRTLDLNLVWHINDANVQCGLSSIFLNCDDVPIKRMLICRLGTSSHFQRFQIIFGFFRCLSFRGSCLVYVVNCDWWMIDMLIYWYIGCESNCWYETRFTRYFSSSRYGNWKCAINNK